MERRGKINGIKTLTKKEKINKAKDRINDFEKKQEKISENRKKWGKGEG